MDNVFDATSATADKDNTAANTTTDETTDVVAKRLEEKDNFIKQLQSETAEMRAEIARLHEASKQLDPLKRELQSIKAELNNGQPRGNTSPALSEVDIRSLVQQTITEAESNKTAEHNLKEASDKIASVYSGDVTRAHQAMAQKASEYGLSVEFLKSVAAKSPSAFMKFMTESTAQSADKGSSFVQSKVNTNALGNQNNAAIKEGTEAYYSKMRREDPAKYYSPAVQLKKMEDARKGVLWGNN